MTIPQNNRRFQYRAIYMLPLIVLGLATAPIGVVDAETIRGSLVNALILEEGEATPEPVTLRSEDVVGVGLGSSLRFVEGIQLEVTIPPVAREIGGGLALYLYAAPTASLDEFDGNAAEAGTADNGISSFEGREIFFLPLPARNRILVKVPIQEDNDFRQTADVYVANATGQEGFPLLAQIVPVMKGLPERATRARFTLTAKPLIRNIGAVRLFLLHPDGTLINELQEYGLEVTLNGSRVGPARLGDETTLLPGLHRISVTSEQFDDESLTFGVERGRVTELRVELQRPRSTLRIDAPELAELFVNGDRIGEGQSSLTLPPGEHTLLFRLGEYSVSRKVVVEPKQDYEISLSLDILVSED